MKKYMENAIKMAEKAYKMDEIPVGAVVVFDGKIIGEGYNLKETNNDPIAHAEIQAIRKACEYIGDWRLSDCELYVTMEPCMMCCGAILQARIKKVYYEISNKKFGGKEYLIQVLKKKENNHYVELIQLDITKKNLDMLQDFFKKKRH